VTIISRPVIGKIIDKTGFFMPGILSALGVAVTLVLISIATNIRMFCIAGVFAGLGLGTGMGTLQTMAVASAPAERRGVATSTYLFGLDAGLATGAVIAGAIADAVGYSDMYLCMAVFPIIACLIFVIFGKKRISQYSKAN
jgi:MFS family permease